MSILNLLKILFQKITSYWGSLSDEQKVAIATQVAKGFEAAIRWLYKTHQAKKTSSQQSTQGGTNV